MEKFLAPRTLLKVAPTLEEAVDNAATHFLHTAAQAQKKRGEFTVALSGGSTPKAVYQQLKNHPLAATIDWNQVFLFWSDERAVPPTHPESNYRMAMVEGGLDQLSIPQKNIFRMEAERDLEANALAYEKLLATHLGKRGLDLVLLGVGEEGHTASLFPHTAALQANGRKVLPNFIPEKKCWRMTFTLPWINTAETICIYALGSSKAAIVETLFTTPLNPELYPVQGVGSQDHPAIWFLDQAACAKLQLPLK